jgi:hypothetical protein
MIRHFKRLLIVARWWFAVTYLAAGIGAWVAGPVLIGRGDYGGVYMLVGGSLIAFLGWTFHPWGLQRRRCANR